MTSEHGAPQLEPTHRDEDPQDASEARGSQAKKASFFKLKKLKVGRNPSAGSIYNENKQEAGKHILASPCM